jgi:hypothetical protein
LYVSKKAVMIPFCTNTLVSIDLPQKSIPRMDRLHSIGNTNLDDIVNIQVLCHGRFVSIQLEGLIGLVTMLGETI